MKLTQMLACASVAALCLSTGNLFAQDNGGPGGPGGGGPGGGRGGRGNFDPAQMQQRINERIKERFGSTDEEWKAIEPLVTKVNEARMAAAAGGMRSMFGGRNRGGGQGGGPRFGPEPSAEETALSDAIENNASKDDLKAKMAAFRKAKASKEAELKTAQENLKKVLTTKQEAVALEMGLVQ
jgi:hypothetical protein